MQKNKEIHITYIGRLEKEKGIEVVINCLKRAIVEERKIIWHICGEGSYMKEFQDIQHSYLKIHGHVDKKMLDAVLEKTDLVLMPSLFLETFGLVALETLSHGVGVCGFSQGGLRNFVHPSLTLDPASPIDSFFAILDRGNFPVLDTTDFSYDLWIERLKQLTEGVESILIVNDYLDRIGGAEQYFHDLIRVLRSLGKTVSVFAYPGSTNRYLRIGLMITAPFAFWRGIALKRRISMSNPDCIWMHSVLRYIGPHGIRAVSESHCPTYITHHDLGLITLRPSQIYRETDIPKSSNLGDWMPKNIGVVSILVTLIKWLYIRWIWRYLQGDRITHILPSSWMAIYFQQYYHTDPIIFVHTTIPRG